MTTTTATPTFSVKNYKSRAGHEGFGFEITLYRDGVRLGQVFNYGDGGSHHYDQNLYGSVMTELEEAGRTLYGEQTCEPADDFINHLVEIAQNNKDAKKHLLLKKRPLSSDRFDDNPTYLAKFDDRRAALRYLIKDNADAIVWDIASQSWLPIQQALEVA